VCPSDGGEPCRAMGHQVRLPRLPRSIRVAEKDLPCRGRLAGACWHVVLRLRAGFGTDGGREVTNGPAPADTARRTFTA
jgi:hypothetical protein